jgi:hypothetical protein
MNLPRFFIVGERPVRFVATPEGGMDVQAYDWSTRRFVRDMSYLSRCTGPAPSVECDELDEDAFVVAFNRIAMEDGRMPFISTGLDL